MKKSIFNPDVTDVTCLGVMFNELLSRYRDCFWSFRHNVSGHAETMLRGYLQLSGKRTCTEIAAKILGDVDKAQNL